MLQAGSPIVEKMKNCIARIKAENPGISDADAKKMAMKKMMKGKGYKEPEAKEPMGGDDDMDD